MILFLVQLIIIFCWNIFLPVCFSLLLFLAFSSCFLSCLAVLIDMRFFLWLKSLYRRFCLGFVCFVKRRSAVSFALPILGFVLVLLCLVFTPCSASALADSPNILSFYDFRPFTSTSAYSYNGTTRYWVASDVTSDDFYTMTVSHGSPYWNDTYTRFSGYTGSIDPNSTLTSFELSQVQPLTGGAGFYIHPSYIGTERVFSYTFHYTPIGGSISTFGRVSNVGLRLWLSDGSWLYTEFVSSYRSVGTSSDFEYFVNLRLVFPESAKGKYVVGFKLIGTFNLGLVASGSTGLLQASWSVSINDIIFPNINTVDEISQGVSGALDNYLEYSGDYLQPTYEGIDGFISNIDNNFDALYDEIHEHFSYENVFSVDFFPQALQKALAAWRFVLEFIYSNRLWLKNLVGWSLAFGGFCMLLSILPFARSGNRGRRK